MVERGRTETTRSLWGEYAHPEEEMRWSEHWYWRPLQFVAALVMVIFLHITIALWWVYCKLFERSTE